MRGHRGDRGEGAQGRHHGEGAPSRRGGTGAIGVSMAGFRTLKFGNFKRNYFLLNDRNDITVRCIYRDLPDIVTGGCQAALVTYLCICNE